MNKQDTGSKVVRESGRFRIVRDAWRGHTPGRKGLRIDWIVETEGERGVMAFDTLREAREWFDALVAEEAAKAQPLRAKLCTPVSVEDAARLAATGSAA